MAHKRRLEHLAACCRSAGAAISPIPVDPDSHHAELLPLPLDINGGGVCSAKLRELQEQKRAALALEDYRRVAEMDDMIRVFSLDDDTHRVTVADAASLQDTDAREAFFLRNGFCVLPAVFRGEHLQRLQEAWRRVQRPARARHVERAAERLQSGNSTFFDLPVPDMYKNLETQVATGQEPVDAVLLDLVDPPPLVDLLRRLLGQTVRMRGIQARTFTPAAVDIPMPKGYIGWHHDRDGPGMGVSVNPAAIIKVFTYFEAVGPDDGPTTVVPGSHRLTFDPRHAFVMVDGTEAEEDGAPVPGRAQEVAEAQGHYQVQPQTAMPNALQLTVAAGDVALFDTSIWHTAGANTGGKDRENTIIRYHGLDRSHTTGANGNFAPELLAQLDKAGLLDDTRKEILCMNDDS
jgi:hypothetical protein